MSNSIIELAAIVLVILIIIMAFVLTGIRLRKYGGSFNTIMQGSTYEFLSKDKREASKEIVEMNASKKTEEQSLEGKLK